MSDSTLEENIKAAIVYETKHISTYEPGMENLIVNQPRLTQTLLSLYQKELEDQVKEEVGRILFKLPPEARKHLEPYLQAGLKRIEQELTGEQP